MFGERLKSERRRLKLNQEDFGRLCGVELLAQSNYERGKRTPDSDYLQKAHLAGVDVGYLLTGQPTNLPISTEEAYLLQKFRTLSDDQKQVIMKFLIGGFDNLSNAIINSPNAQISNHFGG